MLHTALRAPRGRGRSTVDGHNVVPDVHEVLGRMAAFADRVRSGAWRGATGETMRTVVNIGIGGSDLGPAMAYLATEPFGHPELRVPLRQQRRRRRHHRQPRRPRPGDDAVHRQLEDVHHDRDADQRPHRRATGSTAALGDDAVGKHFVAVSTNADEVAEFGIDTANMFGFWDWVGGRYSVDSAIGLSLMIVDRPGRVSPSSSPASTSIDEPLPRRRRSHANAPVVHGHVGHLVRQRARCARPRRCCRTRRSCAASRPTCSSSTWSRNGKRVRLDGSPVTTTTGPIVWGEPGTNGQHAFYQLLHQGTRLVPIDFIGFAQPEPPAAASSTIC